jgi:hypothetical protein
LAAWQEEQQGNGGGMTGEDREIDAAARHGGPKRQRVAALEAKILGNDRKQVLTDWVRHVRPLEMAAVRLGPSAWAKGFIGGDSPLYVRMEGRAWGADIHTQGHPFRDETDHGA